MPPDSTTQPPLATPGPRVSGIPFPAEYRLPGKPDDGQGA